MPSASQLRFLQHSNKMLRLGRCIGVYRGHMDVVLVYVEHTSPMPRGGTSQIFLHL